MGRRHPSRSLRRCSSSWGRDTLRWFALEFLFGWFHVGETWNLMILNGVAGIQWPLLTTLSIRVFLYCTSSVMGEIRPTIATFCYFHGRSSFSVISMFWTCLILLLESQILRVVIRGAISSLGTSIHMYSDIRLGFFFFFISVQYCSFVQDS